MKPQGLEIITVALDSRGAEGAGEWIRAATPEHPSLIDVEHRVAALYNMVNVPTGVWIDEGGRVVRPNEVAFVDNRWIDYTKTDMTRYVAGLRDWVVNGAASAFALTEAELRRRMALPTPAQALAAANFRLGQYLHAQGHWEDAIPCFKQAQAFHPESWCYKRQAWALSDAEKYYGTSFKKEVEALGGKPYYAPLDLPSVG
ncbi:MAG: thioredoxin family protein [Candidatus Rokubacteria bacterium]|nr:thioredoxin family protein [Candidatus Rokubacteria bacterium]